MESIRKNGLPTQVCQLGQTKLHELMTAEVVCEGEKSQSLCVKTGVKQGGVLAPTLFVLFLAAVMAEMIHKVGNRECLFSIEWTAICTMYIEFWQSPRFQLRLSRIYSLQMTALVAH